MVAFSPGISGVERHLGDPPLDTKIIMAREGASPKDTQSYPQYWGTFPSSVVGENLEPTPPGAWRCSDNHWASSLGGPQTQPVEVKKS